MKAQRAGLIIVVLAALLLSAAAVQAGTTSPFTAVKGACQYLDYGTITYIPNEDHPAQIHYRGTVARCLLQSSDPRVNGYNTLTMNANFDANGLGPVWGTALWEPLAGGSWDVTWAGMSTPLDPGDPFTPTHWEVHSVGNGVGIYEGMKVFVDTHAGLYTGEILDPHGTK